MAEAVAPPVPSSRRQSPEDGEVQQECYYRQHEEVFNNIRVTMEKIEQRRQNNSPAVAEALRMKKGRVRGEDEEIEHLAEVSIDNTNEGCGNGFTSRDGKKDLTEKVKRRGSKFVSAVSQRQQKLQGRINASLASQQVQRHRATISGAWGSVRDSIQNRSTSSQTSNDESNWKAKSVEPRSNGATDGSRSKWKKRLSGSGLLSKMKNRRSSLGNMVSGNKEKMAVYRVQSSPNHDIRDDEIEDEGISLKDLVEKRPVGKVPLRVRLRDDVRGSGAEDDDVVLASGDVLTVLKAEDDAMLRFQGREMLPGASENTATNNSFRARVVTFEESAAQFRDLCAFRVLPACPQHEGRLFNTVRDVMEAKPSPPERVRVIGTFDLSCVGVDDSLQAGDCLIFGNDTCVKNGRQCTVWFRRILTVTPDDDVTEAAHPNNNIIARKKAVALPLDADIGFSADFPEDFHSLQNLAEDIQSGLLSLPCRVSISQTKARDRSLKPSSEVPHSLIGRRHLITRVTPTQNLLVTNGHEVIRLPRMLCSRLHCVQLGMDTPAMLSALKILMQKADYSSDIRTLRAPQTSSLSAQLESQLVYALPWQRNNQPSSGRGIPAGAVINNTGPERDVLVRTKREPQTSISSRMSNGSRSSLEESGLGSDTSARPFSTSPYASIDEVATRKVLPVRHPSSSSDGDEDEKLLMSVNIPALFQCRNSQEDIVPRSPNSPTCSSLSSTGSHRRSSPSPASSSSCGADAIGDGDDLTTVTPSIVTLLTGCTNSIQRQTGTCRVSSSDGTTRENITSNRTCSSGDVAAAATTYDIPTHGSVPTGNTTTAVNGHVYDCLSMKETRRLSDPPTPGSRIPKPNRPPPPVASAGQSERHQQPEAGAINPDSSSASEQLTSRSSSSNRLQVRNRFSSSYSGSTTSPGQSPSITCGTTPEMAMHWRSRCEQLRSELYTVQEELDVAHDEIEYLRAELHARDSHEPPPKKRTLLAVARKHSPRQAQRQHQDVESLSSELSRRLHQMTDNSSEEDRHSKASEVPTPQKRKGPHSRDRLSNSMKADLAAAITSRLASSSNDDEASCKPKSKPRTKEYAK